MASVVVEDGRPEGGRLAGLQPRLLPGADGASDGLALAQGVVRLPLQLPSTSSAAGLGVELRSQAARKAAAASLA
jgi:hypothetical protein